MKRSWKKSVFSKSSIDLDLSVEFSSQNVETKSPEKLSDEIKKKVVKSQAVEKCTNWMEFFSPKTPEDLAIHSKKLLEVKQWFLDNINTTSSAAPKNVQKSKICLITGPTGAGKTAAVRVFAENNQFEIMEWINPVDQHVITNLGDQMFGDSYVVSHLTAFKSFLHRASRYKSIGCHKKRILLVEDFPNALLNDSTAFEEILTDYIGFGASPIIFIVSDSKSRGLNISYNLFPEEVKQRLQIKHISFNAVADTFMKKAMKRFISLLEETDKIEGEYKLPSADLIDSIILSAQGDIRNALINFHFAALKGAPEVCTSEDNLLNTTKKSRSKKQTKNLKSIGRDGSCTMLHTLGRVFNPKFTSDQKLTHNPESIALDFSTEPKRFLDFLQANYLLHFSDLDYVIPAADCLSIADVFLQEYRNEALSTIGLNIAIRGLMMENQKPVNGWMPVRGPKRYNPGEKLKPSKFLTPNISKNLQAVDYQTFIPIIDSNQGK